jgi:hypothetical protein
VLSVSLPSGERCSLVLRTVLGCESAAVTDSVGQNFEQVVDSFNASMHLKPL